MSIDEVQRRHQEFMRQNHERRLNEVSNETTAASAELIAERIAAKLAEQNDIIYKIGQKQGRTGFVAYLSLAIGGIAAIAQIFGPIWDWPIFRAMLG
ncbi:MAG TPA: hypothetical protein VKA94_01970 [Hyphomicrobiales bacterium]|nr:hypothetical protein [Hyphomicrobiales bacterium]